MIGIFITFRRYDIATVDSFITFFYLKQYISLSLRNLLLFIAHCSFGLFIETGTATILGQKYHESSLNTDKVILVKDGYYLKQMVILSTTIFVWVSGQFLHLVDQEWEGEIWNQLISLHSKIFQKHQKFDFSGKWIVVWILDVVIVGINDRL